MMGICSSVCQNNHHGPAISADVMRNVLWPIVPISNHRAAVISGIGLIGAGEGGNADVAEAETAADTAQFLIPERNGLPGHHNAWIARLCQDHDIWIAQPNTPAPRQVPELRAGNTGLVCCRCRWLGFSACKPTGQSKRCDQGEASFQPVSPLGRSSNRRA